MRYYWEALFSVEYFPYWEFTMLMILLLNLSMLWRVHRIEKKIDIILPMLSNAKNRTAEYYNENPGSYGIKYPTDAILVELDDIIEQLKAGDENIIKSV